MWNFMTPAQNAAYDRWESTWRNGPNDYEEEPPLEEEDYLFDAVVSFTKKDLEDITNALIAADYPETYVRMFRDITPDHKITLDNVDLHILIETLREPSQNPDLADDLEDVLDEAREDYLKSKVTLQDMYS